MPNPDQRRFALGKDCTFTVSLPTGASGISLPSGASSVQLKSVRDVGVRRIVTEHDATGYGHKHGSTVVVRRTWEIDIEVLKPEEIAVLVAIEEHDGVVKVTTANGLRAVSADFMICDSDVSEPLDDCVRGRFTLKQWKHGAI